MKKSVIILVGVLMSDPRQLCDFIDDSCNKTPHPDVCVSVLRAGYPYVTNASSVSQFASYLVGDVGDKKDAAFGAFSGLPQTKPVNDCRIDYYLMDRDDLNQAKAKIAGGEGEKAAKLMDDVVAKVDACEAGFGGQSPGTKENNVLRDIASVAVAID